MANTLRAGKIQGDPTAGLCERVCIEVMRVYDGCRENSYNREVRLVVDGIAPQAVEPFTFVEAFSDGEATWTTTSVTPVANGKYRFVGEITIPITVTLTDANGAAYAGRSSLRLGREYTLSTPSEALVPYRLEVLGIFRSRVGSFENRTTVLCTACIVTIAKIVAPTDLLVPAYGTCVYPECTSGQNSCRALIGLSLFPEG